MIPEEKNLVLKGGRNNVNWNGIMVDDALPTSFLEKINTVRALEITSVCAGHKGNYALLKMPSIYSFLERSQSIKVAKNPVKYRKLFVQAAKKAVSGLKNVIIDVEYTTNDMLMYPGSGEDHDFAMERISVRPKMVRSTGTSNWKRDLKEMAEAFVQLDSSLQNIFPETKKNSPMLEREQKRLADLQANKKKK